MAEARTYWLSFTDPQRPVGSQFLGVCIIDVTEEAAAAERERMARTFPQAKAGAEWLAAALRRAWQCGANPGGEVGTLDITGHAEAIAAPRDRLLSRAELEALNLA